LGIAVFGAWITLDAGWMTFGAGGAGFVPLDAAGRADPLLAAMRVLQLALVVPVMEELFWRSFVLRWIDARDFLGVDPRHASRAAVAICSALFALEHALWLAGFIAGMVYTLLYVRSGDLRVSILSHMVTNGILATWILATGSWHLW
jgi:uncharacterized protein